jgi:hypothetical protein
MVTTDAKGTSAAAVHPAEPEATPSQAGDGSQPAVETRRAAGGSRTTTIRLPLISATFTRPSRPDSQQQPRATRTSSGVGEPAPAGPAGTGVHSVGGVSLSRAAFYAGAVALGALEVVEWPVTLLVVAGTYLADQVRGPATPAAIPPGSGPSASAVPVPPPAAPHAGA